MRRVKQFGYNNNFIIKFAILVSIIENESLLKNHCKKLLLKKSSVKNNNVKKISVRNKRPNKTTPK